MQKSVKNKISIVKEFNLWQAWIMNQENETKRLEKMWTVVFELANRWNSLKRANWFEAVLIGDILIYKTISKLKTFSFIEFQFP